MVKPQGGTALESSVLTSSDLRLVWRRAIVKRGSSNLWGRGQRHSTLLTPRRGGGLKHRDGTPEYGWDGGACGGVSHLHSRGDLSSDTYVEIA